MARWTDLDKHLWFLNRKNITFFSAIPIGFQIAYQKTRRRTKTLKGSDWMGEGRAYFSENFRASLYLDLSYEPNFSQIHLARLYL